MSLQSLFDQLGLVNRETYEELELRVAQLEHRLRLAESQLEAGARARSQTAAPAAGTDSSRSQATSARP